MLNPLIAFKDVHGFCNQDELREIHYCIGTKLIHQQIL